ncbi:hypothetical protein Bca52824_047366 [Brassica carinata]|uniref:Uncharacterized protein n=1 Tax=Brassica carinata TaxID=52824 RepID=A0A8X7UR68_BRACI|nr:hypothetical protein Bca52824_047366 [Brassica carinata]
MRPGHAARHVEDVVSPCMEPGHESIQVEGVVSYCMRLRHAASHVEHEVSPCMRTEPCEVTHGVPHGLFLIVQNVREKAKKERSSFDSFGDLGGFRNGYYAILSQHRRRFCSTEEISSSGDQFKTILDVGLLEKVEKGFGSQKSGSCYLEVGSWQLANAECLDDIAKLWIVSEVASGKALDTQTTSKAKGMKKRRKCKGEVGEEG